MSDVLPTHCQVALKEWASVVEAFSRGEQLVLVRKGGLAEARSGFTLASRLFLFYPTFEHQTVQFLREPYHRDLEEAMARLPAAPTQVNRTRAAQAGKSPDGTLRIELCGVAVCSTQTQDPTVLKRLSPFHIYNDAFFTQRLKWQPEQPLGIVVVRAFRLPSPQCLPWVSRYAGCKSWVDLEQAVALDGARPVLDDEAFGERLNQIHALLQSDR